MSYNLPPPRGDVKRLPKWAQDHIASLTREIERQDEHIAKISNEHPGSNVMLDARVGNPDVTLPPDSTVRLYLGRNREDYHDCIEIHHNRQNSRLIEFRSYGGRLHILPHAGNSFSIMTEER